MNEGRIARLFGLTLGGLLTAGLVLNALAFLQFRLTAEFAQTP